MRNPALLSNAHTHSTFCDGKNTPEEMVLSALALGFDSLGFSSHGPQAFDRDYSVKGERAYIDEINRLKAEYAGRIRIWLGVEFDVLGLLDAREYDYVIGGVHYVRCTGAQYAVDGPPERLSQLTREAFGGDGIMMVSEYYRQVALCARQLRPDILAHFDVIRKFNGDGAGKFFDTGDNRYRRAALGALESSYPYVKMLEINTGGMARGLLKTPYPDEFLLSAWREMGGDIIINSDSHRADTLNFAFGEAAELARRCGFKAVMRLGTGQLFERAEI